MSSYALAYPVCGNTAMKLWRIVESLKRSSAMYSVFLYMFVCLWPCLLLFIVNPLKAKTLYTIFAVAPFFFMSALRGYRVGTDTIQFVTAFNTMHFAHFDLDKLFLFRYEPFFLIQCKLLSFISEDPHILIIGTTVITYVGVVYAILKMSKNVAFSVFLYGATLMFFVNMNLVRQAMAMSMIFIAICFLLENNTKKYLIFSLFAFLFHYSAIIPSLIIWLGYKSFYYNRYNVIICMMIVTVISVFFIKNLVSFFPSYQDYVKNMISYRRFIFHFIILSPLLIVLSRDLFSKDRMLYLFAFAALVEWIFALLAMYNANFSRFVFYFHPLLIITIPNYIINKPIPKRTSTFITTNSFFIIYAILALLIMLPAYGLFPYEFMWNESIQLGTSFHTYLF